MSTSKRSDGWISLFAFIGILMLVASMYVVITIHMEFNPITIFMALIPNTTYWTWFCFDLWARNGRPRYLYRWIDLDTGKEVRHATPSSDTISIRQKVSGCGGSSALIVPENCVFPNASFWSLDQSSSLSEIALVDTYGVVVRTTSLATAICTIMNDWSVTTLLDRSRQDALRLQQFGNQRDELIGAFLCLLRLVDEKRDTFGNSPYGALLRHYTNTVLRNLLEQDVDLTRSVFIDQMNKWQHLADQCITRFGRR